MKIKKKEWGGGHRVDVNKELQLKKWRGGGRWVRRDVTEK